MSADLQLLGRYCHPGLDVVTLYTTGKLRRTTYDNTWSFCIDGLQFRQSAQVHTYTMHCLFTMQVVPTCLGGHYRHAPASLHPGGTCTLLLGNHAKAVACTAADCSDISPWSTH